MSVTNCPQLKCVLGWFFSACAKTVGQKCVLNLWDLLIKIYTDDKIALYKTLNWIMDHQSNEQCGESVLVHRPSTMTYTHMEGEATQPRWVTVWPIQHILSPLAKITNKTAPPNMSQHGGNEAPQRPRWLANSEKISNPGQSNKIKACSLTRGLDKCRGW